MSMILTQQDSEENLLRFVAHAVEFLGPFKTYGIFAGDTGRMSGQPGRKMGPLASRPADPPGRPDPGGVPGLRGQPQSRLSWAREVPGWS